jgi:uncharacterized repeat protein (TIGR01451 family)
VRFVLATLLASVLLVPSAGAQTGPGAGADLSLSLVKPATTPLVGDVFDLVTTVRNDGPETAPEAFFSNYLPQELELKSITSSDPADSCGVDQPFPEAYASRDQASRPDGSTSSGSAPAGKGMAYSGGGAAACSLGDMALGDQAVITMTVKRIGARESYNSGWVGSNVDDPDYNDNYTELYLEADKSHPADIGVLLTTSSKSPDVGGAFAIKAEVTNNGPSTADSVTLVDSIFDGMDLGEVTAERAGDTCEINEYPGYQDPGTEGPAYGGYSEVVCSLAPLARNATATFTINVTRTTAWEIYNNAWAISSNYDENYENDYGFVQIPADPSVTSDLSLKMSGPDTTPLVGDTFDLNVTLSNDGPSQAGDVWVSDYLPPSLEFVSTTPADRCTYNDSGPYPLAGGPASDAAVKGGESYYPGWGNGLYCDIGALPAGESTTFSVTVTRVNAWETWNSSWVSSSNYDPNYENNYSDMMIEADKSHPADLGVKMTAPENPEVGSDFDFVIEATNNGPSDANNVVVSDYIPYGTEFRAVTSSDSNDVCQYTDYPTYEGDSSGGGVAKPAEENLRPSFYGFQQLDCELGTLAAGETATINITVNRTIEYEIWNSAWIMGANYDENFDNDYASVLVGGEPYPGACSDEGEVDGTKGSDDIVVGDCDIKTGGGADSIGVVPSSEGGRSSNVFAGKGRDNISVDVALGATSQRFIQVNGGDGDDTITITVAPGAGAATIVVNGDAGNDAVMVNAPAGASGLRILIKGGSGNDSVGPTGTSNGQGVTGLSLRGGGGKDILQGGDGDDLLTGGSGLDRLFGGLGDDEMRGGRGPDVCRGGPGRNAYKTC